MQDQESRPKQRRKKVKITQFPAIPDKLYFSIGETSKLCAIKPYVIRFWEQAFPMLKPAKLRCGRRYYRQEEILLIRTIRTLLYEQGFTIDGACLQLAGSGQKELVQNTAAAMVAQECENKGAESIPIVAEPSTVETAAITNSVAKTKLLKEVANKIDDIISLLEEKPETESA